MSPRKEVEKKVIVYFYFVYLFIYFLGEESSLPSDIFGKEGDRLSPQTAEVKMKLVKGNRLVYLVEYHGHNIHLSDLMEKSVSFMTYRFDVINGGKSMNWLWTYDLLVSIGCKFHTLSLVNGDSASLTKKVLLISYLIF